VAIPSNTLSELLKLSPEERIQLAQELWDSIPPDTEAPVLSDDERREIDRRASEHDANPSSAIPWASARETLRRRFGA